MLVLTVNLIFHNDVLLAAPTSPAALQSPTPLPPLAPNLVYPSNGLANVPSSFTLRWNSGLDAARTTAQWPVTYAIYYKVWANGGAEPANYALFASGLPCNPDSTGTCTMAVPGMGAGIYRIYIVANMDVSASTGVANSILSTPSAPARFSTGNIPISLIPAPLPPGPVYPSDGLLNLPSSFTIRWSDGLDASRRNSLWPVTYAIYYKSWANGVAEPSSYTLFASGLPCNPDSTGFCTKPVAGISLVNYRWYAVASMDVSASTGVANSTLSTQGPPAFFTGATQPVPPVQSPPNRAIPVQLQPSAPSEASDVDTVDATVDAAPAPVPVWMVYRSFFLHLAHLDQLADQDQANGNAEGANGWRTFEQQAAGLTDSEAQLMKQVAYSCNDQLKTLDATIQTQITNFRTQYPNGKFLTVPIPPGISQSFQQKVATVNSCIAQISTDLGAASFQKLDNYVQTHFQPAMQAVPGPAPAPAPMPVSGAPATDITVNDVPSVGMYSFTSLNVTSHGVEGSMECSAQPDGVTLANYDVVETECHLYANGADVASTVPCFTDPFFPFTFCQATFIPVTGVVYNTVGFHSMAMLKVQPENSTSSCYWADPLRYGIPVTPPILDEQGTVFAGRGPNSCWGDTNGSLLGLATTLSNPFTVIVVSPSQATVFPGGTQQFSGNIALKWSMVSGPGSIDASSGLYTAPATIDKQQTAIVQGCNPNSPGNCATAKITLSPVTFTVSIDKSELISAESAQLTVTFNPSAFDPTSAVDWSLSPNVGAVTTVSGKNNVYIAPLNGSIPSGLTTLTITGKSHKNPTITATATVTLTHIDAVLVSPVKPNLLSGETTTVTAVTSPATLVAHDVTWTPSAGTINKPLLAPNAASYTAPTVTKEQPVTITASVGGVTGEASLMVVPPVVISSITPAAWNSGEAFQITIQGTGFGSNPQVDFGDPTIGFSQVVVSDTSITGTVSVPISFLARSITLTVANRASAVIPPPVLMNVNINPVAITVALSPATATVPVGQSATFTPNVTCKTAGGKPCSVSQAVNCALKTQIGTVNSGAACVYTATPPVSSQQSVQITACSAVVPVPCTPTCSSQTCGTATVTVPPVNVTVAPKNVTLLGGQTKPFTYTVVGNPNTVVAWSIIADPLVPPGTLNGNVDQNGKYTAPNPITVQQAIKIRACSQADSSRCDDAPVSLIPLIVSPSTVVLKASQMQTFSAATSGTNTLVDWSLDPNVPAAGSITPQGVYTAPSSLSTVTRPTVVATSKADGSKGTATVFLAASCYPRCRAVRHTSAATVGQAYSGSVMDPTVDTPQGFIYSGNLPPNLNFATDTGAITGVPVQPPAIYGFSATPFYADGDGGTEVYAFPVCQSTSAPPITAGPFTMRNAYSIPYVPGINPGGMFGYSVTGMLPPGMSLDPFTGAVSGVPSAAGTYTYTIHTVLNVSAVFPACTPGTSTDAVYQVTISCDASCLAASLAPASLIFGGQSAGTTSSAQAITLSNSGTGAMSISSITTSGDFAQTNNCGSSVGAGASCIINVTFTPTAGGTRTGTLSVSDNATGSPHTASLSGTGLTPSVSLSPGSLAFAGQALGTSSGGQSVTLTNTGAGALSISSMTATGDFAQTSSCGNSLAAGASCNINVTFTPTAAGLRTGTLTVNDNAPGSPRSVSLSGAVVQGYHDVANCQGSAGWAWDSTQPNTPITVYVFDGNRFLASVYANEYRPDLAGSFGAGYHGFTWGNDVSVLDGAPHNITVHFSPDPNSPALSNSPRSISCSPSLTFAWIQPSGITWGPANTLTTAGFANGGVGSVALSWRDATLNGPWNSVPYQVPPNSWNGGWSNTIPSADTCHAFQATVTYSGVTVGNDYDGVALGFCSFRVIWIQPQSTAGFGPPGSLVVAGSAQGGPPNAQVTMWFRDDTAQSGWTSLSYAPIPDATGIWYNAIPNVDFTHQYSVYITYDDRNSGGCSYFGNGAANNCP